MKRLSTIVKRMKWQTCTGPLQDTCGRAVRTFLPRRESGCRSGGCRDPSRWSNWLVRRRRPPAKEVAIQIFPPKWRNVPPPASCTPSESLEFERAQPRNISRRFWPRPTRRWGRRRRRRAKVDSCWGRFWGCFTLSLSLDYIGYVTLCLLLEAKAISFGLNFNRKEIWIRKGRVEANL